MPPSSSNDSVPFASPQEPCLLRVVMTVYPLPPPRNQWEAYKPYTNVQWLHYLCDKLIHHKRFQETDRSHRDSLKRLRQTHSDLLQYSSAAHFVLEDVLFDS